MKGAVMNAKYLYIVYPALLLSLFTYSPASASIRDLFHKHRFDTDTVLYLNNGNVLHGRLLNQDVGMYTPYGYVQAPIGTCAETVYIPV